MNTQRYPIQINRKSHLHVVVGCEVATDPASGFLLSVETLWASARVIRHIVSVTFDLQTIIQ